MAPVGILSDWPADPRTFDAAEPDWISRPGCR